MVSVGARGAVAGDWFEVGGIGAGYTLLGDIPVHPFALEVCGWYVRWVGMISAELAESVVDSADDTETKYYRYYDNSCLG